MVKTKLFANKKLLIALLVIILAGGSALAYVGLRSDGPQNQNPTSQPSSTSSDQSSSAEKAEAEQHKDELVKQQAQQDAANQTSPPPSKKQVSVVVTGASASRVSAYASGIFEDGGTCTVSFTQGSAAVTKKSAGFKNATTTNCTPIDFSRSDFPSSGTWNLTVSYSSQAAEGTSQSQAVAVQ